MDFQTIIIVIAVVLLIAYIFNRMQSRGSQMGSERPRYNDPNVQGQGSFGSNRSNPSVSNYQRDEEQDRFDNAPGAQSQTSSNYQRERYATPGQNQNRSGSQSQSSGRRDNPNVQGQGSFGRDKD